MKMSRIENYNEEQKLYLLYCIRGVVDTVEDARKDTTTTLRRKSVWDDLSNTFNSRFSSRRPSSPAAHLKNLWKRLKLLKQLLYCSLYCTEGLSGVISVNVSYIIINTTNKNNSEN